jgi:hypothetical protein
MHEKVQRIQQLWSISKSTILGAEEDILTMKFKGMVNMKFWLIVIVVGLSSCTTIKGNKKMDANKNEYAGTKTPFLTSPKVRKVWVPEKIEGDKLIEGHWMWVLERTSTWSQ